MVARAMAARPMTAAADRRCRLIIMSSSRTGRLLRHLCFLRTSVMAARARLSLQETRGRCDTFHAAPTVGRRPRRPPEMQRTKPPYRADHVGSLIRPDALIKAREQAEKGAISPAELRRIQQAAIRDVVRMQEELGLKLVTDGEYNRHSWHRDFMLKFKNVRMIPSKLTVRFHSADGDRLHSPPTMQVTGKLARPNGGGIFVDDFKFLASIARATPKITLPSPTVMHFRGGREAIDADAYPDIAEFYDDLSRLYR